MGCVVGKYETGPFEKSIDLKAKIRSLENEIMESMCKREQERQWREQMFQSFIAKELEWKGERKIWKEEMEEVTMRSEEREERIQWLEKEATMAAEKGGKEWWQGLRASFLVEHMREEHARREEAVEKWKRLYQAIKTELDDLILRTSQGERLWWGADEEEDVMDSLQRELNAKDGTIEALRKQISVMAKEGANREREVDILRQSLRIVSNAQQSHLSNNVCIFDTESDKTKRRLG
ncbi:hypothetical protein MRB53_002791 [Persea americana]|uniref:Uncharacterized protein n=1 Tax=Persea americana TaxID=3435 RepID=A0ACC2MWF8_PERAE|nr:hypothetical protein MRB53_002791 [Persea americana]